MIRSGTINTIHELATQGKSIREIARILGIARNTVRRYLRGKRGRKSESSKQMSIAQAVHPTVLRGIVCPEMRAAECLYPNHWVKPHIRDVALQHCREVATNNSAGYVRTQNKTWFECYFCDIPSSQSKHLHEGVRHFSFHY